MLQLRARRGAALAAIAAFAVMIVGFGTGGTSFAAAARPAVVAHASSSLCQVSGASKAKGSPILLGAIVTNQPGTSFTDITNTANGYFTCVNDHGGIHGHPIKYFIEQEQSSASQVAALATKLIQTDHVMGIVGNTSIIDCAVNGSYYASHHFYIIDDGVASQCYASPWSATINMGPRYSSDGAAQYAIAHGAKKLVFDQSAVPGTGYNVGGVQLIAKAAHVPVVPLTETVPIQDPDSVATKEVQDAGPNGAVILNFTPPEAQAILQAAQHLGLENKVKAWGCSTPCNTNSLAAGLGSAWNHKLFVNAELNVPSESGADAGRYRTLMSTYVKGVSLGSFSEMGYLDAEFAVKALLSIKGSFTVKSVNSAFVDLKNVKTDLLCKPWYYQNLKEHLPNNTDYTVTPDNGKMVIAQGCSAISSVDPVVAYVRGIEKAKHL